MKEVELGEIAEVFGGYAFKSKDFNETSGVPVIKISNIQDGEVSEETLKQYLPESYFDDYENYQVTEGDILVALSGATTGKTGVYKREKKSLLNQRVGLVRTKNGQADQKYLSYYVSKITDDILNKAQGVAQPNISTKELAKFKIPLPSLSEQKAIVAKLDRAQRLIDIDKEMLAKYDELIQSVFLEMFGDPVTNPEGFEKSTIGEVCDVKGGKRVPKGQNLQKVKTNHPYIKAQNIKNGVVTLNDLEYLSEDLASKLSRYTVQEGDVCITVVGANIGEIGIVPEKLDEANLTENANKLLIKNKKRLLNTYLAHYMMTDYVEKQIYQKTMAVGVPKLAIFRIKDIEIVIPKIETQKRFSSYLEKIEESKNEIKISLKRSKELFYSLVQGAFV